MNSQTISLCASYKTLYPNLYNLCMGLENLLSNEKAQNNPGALRTSGVELGVVEQADDQGMVFESYHDGLFAFLHDMWARCDGRTSTGLNRESTLEEFVKVFLKERNIVDVNDFLDDLVAWCMAFERDTKMGSFLE